MKSLDKRFKFFESQTVISFVWSFTRSVIALAFIIGLLYGGALLLDSAFGLLFEVS